jgi:PAS domain S-box-containing protein
LAHGLLFWWLLVLAFTGVNAERLPFKNYTTGDGLAHDSVFRIVRDSRGFLWFCTGEGLSRFDGYEFKNYTQADGLPHRVINDLIELAGGKYILATNFGLTVFDPSGTSQKQNSDGTETPMFRTFRPGDAKPDKKSFAIVDLLATRDGKFWAATLDGLYKIEQRPGGEWLFERFDKEVWLGKFFEFTRLFEDSRGGMWIGTTAELYRLAPGGDLQEVPNQIGVRSILEDRAGRIFVGGSDDKSGLGLYAFENESPVLKQVFTAREGLSAITWINDLLETADGRFWIGTGKGLDEFLPVAETGKPQIRRALPETITTICEDGGGNLWVGTSDKGAFKLSSRGFTLFDKVDGISSLPSSIFAGSGNEIFVTGGSFDLLRFDGEKFTAVKPSGMDPRSWGWNQIDFRSQVSGEWWITTSQGIRRYPPVERFEDLATTEPKNIYTTQEGLFTNEVFRLFEDSRGDVWIGVIGSGVKTPNTLSRWDRTTEKIHGYTTEDGLPSQNGAMSYAEDLAGNIWLGYYYGGVARYRNGRFDFYKADEDFPLGIVNAIHRDREGRLWFASGTSGLVRLDDPTEEKPRFTTLTNADGLSSNQALCLTEDNFGRIYIGTGRGVNRLEPKTGRIKIYTQADGLPGSLTRICGRDESGNLWFAQQNILARLIPEVEENNAPPLIFLSDLRVNGATFKKLSELGETTVENIEFASDQRQIQIDFFALRFSTADILRYQYKLDEADWSEPTIQRTVNLSLSPGSYRFLVRAVSADGVTSENPALMSFSIARPIWQRWWFILLAAIVIVGSVIGLDRFRVRKTRQVKTALKQTTESETRYRTLAETASDAIITIDENSIVVYVNEAVEHIFGYKADEIIGEHLTKLMPQRFRSKHEAGLHRYITTNKKNIGWTAVELPGEHKSGAEIPLELSFGEFEKDGKRFFTGIARDISERKRAEAALQKAREERFRELERVRKRIATDLHDDIGSSLTQISLLSEVVNRRVGSDEKPITKPLAMIADTSRELVDAMSDIVWAINPQKDHLSDLTGRMHRFAADVLTAGNIKLNWNAPDLEKDISVGANVRREIFLIFKESINNMVKHSGCTEADLEVKIDAESLEMFLRDNGKGFDILGESDGHGLASIKERAAGLGGDLNIESRLDEGTSIRLKVPFEQSLDGGVSP